MNSGLTVMLDNTIEGYVGIHSIKDDEYTFCQEAQKFIGRKTGKEIFLGDRITVTVNKVIVESKEIIFQIMETGEER